MSEKSKVALAYAVCCLIWGTTWFAVRQSVGPGGFSPFVAAAIRFSVAAVLLWAIVIARRQRPFPADRRTWLMLSLAGVLDAVSYSLVYVGETKIPGGLAAVIFAAQPLILAGILQAVRIEQVRRRDLIAALISVAGIALIFHDQLGISTQQAWGVLCLFGAVIASTMYSMLMRQHSKNVHAMAATAIFIGVTAVCLVALVLIQGASISMFYASRAAWIATMYLAVVGTVIAFSTYFWMIVRMSLAAASTTIFIITIIALAVDAALEQAAISSPLSWLGVATVFAGLVYNYVSRRAGERAAR